MGRRSVCGLLSPGMMLFLNWGFRLFIWSRLMQMCIRDSFTAPAMHAQESVEVLIRENGTERQESIELPKSMTYPLDSLLND